MRLRSLLLATALALASCTGTALYERPTQVLVPDTRAVQAVISRDSARLVVHFLLDTLAHAPRVETGACYYGGIRRYGAFTVLEIAETTIDIDPEATDSTMMVSCPDTSASGLLNVGYAHTHPTVRDQASFCLPSSVDFNSWIHSTDLIMFVFCQNGYGYRQLRDGRWTIFRWTEVPDGTSRG